MLCSAGHAASQESDGPAKELEVVEAFLARSNGNGKAGDPAESFLITDIPIFCVVRLSAPGVATVKIDLVAADVSGVKAGSKVVSVSFTTKENEDRVNFSGRPHGKWVPGKYRVDIYIGTKKVRFLDFEIKGLPTEVAKPATGKPPASKRKPVKRSTAADRYARQTLGKAFW